MDSYSETIAYLYNLRWFGTKFGLENTLKLAELAGNPQERLRFIHVAGTNGKGSTCAMLESIYRAAGLRVGLFTSPHLVSFSERIQVNRVAIPQEEVVSLVNELRPLLKQFAEEHHPTFFEVITVMALLYFARQKCDLVIWETGLGGRLDATNIVTPLVSVVTNIQHDHEKWLGASLDSIAREKAGIIKPGIPAVTAASAPEAFEVIANRARELHSPLTVVTPANCKAPPLDTVPLPLAGRHQRLNAAVALAVVRRLQPVIPVTPEAARQGLSTVSWPGRLQIVTRQSGQTILLDGAHNPDGAATLADSVRDYFPGTKPAFVLGILNDKDWNAMCRILAPLAGRILVVPVTSERTMQTRELAEACRTHNPAADVQEFASLSKAVAALESEALVVIAGSLYLIGEALEVLGVSPSPSFSERSLNEWSAAKSP